jgi:hypothetical protein
LLVFLIKLLLHLKLEDFLLHFILLLDCHGLLVLLHMLNELMVAHALSVGLVLLFKLHLLLSPEGLLVLLRVHWHKHKLVLLLLGQLLTWYLSLGHLIGELEVKRREGSFFALKLLLLPERGSICVLRFVLPLQVLGLGVLG